MPEKEHTSALALGTGTTSDRHRRMMEIMESALALPASQRTAFVELRTKDAQLASSIRQMLYLEARSERLEQPAAAGLAEAVLPAFEEPDPAASLEGYETVRPLTSGGMGTLFLVQHKQLDALRVLKVIHPQLGERASLKSQLLKEAIASRQVRHPNIVEVLDFIEDGSGRGLLVMEWLDGFDLSDLLADRQKLQVSACLAIAQQALAGLEHMHALGFVHRDISPDNLRLVPDETGSTRLKILDLGIAKGPQIQGLDASATLGDFFGKARYAAPERLSTGQPVDGRADLYSLAVVLYEALTGTHPLPGRDMLSLLASHMQEPPIPFEISDPQGKVPERTRRAILIGLEKSPSKRHANARAFAADLGFGETARDTASLDRAISKLRLRRYFADRTSPTLDGRLSVVAGGILLATASLFGPDAAVNRVAPSLEEFIHSGTVGSEGSGNSQFNRLSDIDIAQDGQLYVVDLDNHRVQRLSPTGRHRGSFGSFGSGDAQFDWPQALALEPGGTLLVADSRNARLQRFDREGNFLESLSGRALTDRPLRYPMRLAVAPDGSIYVVDGELDETVLRQLSPDGQSGREILAERPLAVVAVARDGTLYTGPPNGYLSHISTSGEELGWASGKAPGPFEGLLGIAVTKDGSILTADAVTKRVQIFAESGVLISSFGPETAQGGLLDPSALDLDKRGSIWVADHSNHRLQRFVPPLRLLPHFQ